MRAQMYRLVQNILPSSSLLFSHFGNLTAAHAEFGFVVAAHIGQAFG